MPTASRFDRIIAKPLETIQGINALVLALFGLYLASPFYVPSTPASSSSAFSDSVLTRIIFSLVFFVIPALPTILSWFNTRFQSRKWRGRACFYMFIGIACLTLLRVLSVGVNPPIWLFYLATGLTSAVLYLYWQVKV